MLTIFWCSTRAILLGGGYVGFCVTSSADLNVEASKVVETHLRDKMVTTSPSFRSRLFYYSGALFDQLPCLRRLFNM